MLRETISSAVEALGAGKILPEELPFHQGERQRTDKICVAPGYAGGSVPPDGILPLHSYTQQGLAKFLGMLKPNGNASDSFLNAFGALELIAGGYLSEARIKDLEVRKLGEVVASVKKQRDAAIAEPPDPPW